MSEASLIVPVTKALTLNYARRLFWPSAMAVMLLSALVWLIGYTQTAGEYDPSLAKPVEGYFAYVGIGMVIYAAAAWMGMINMAQGSFILPMSTRLLTAFLLVSTSVCIVALNVVVTSFGRIAMNLEWPVVTTSVFLVVFNMVWLTGIWSMKRFSLPKVTAWLMFYAGCIWWFLSRFYRNGFRQSPEFWNSFGVSELCLLLATAVMMWLIAVRSMAAWRRGDFGQSKVPEFFSRQLHMIVPDQTSVNPGLVTAETAYVRMLQLKNRPTAIMLGGFMGVVTFGVIMLSSGNRNELWEPIVLLVPVFSSMSGMLIGSFMGQADESGKRIPLTPFIATLPFSDRVLGRLTATSWLKTSLTAAGLILAGVVAGVGLRTAISGWQPLPEHMGIATPFRSSAVAVFFSLVWCPLVIFAFGGFGSAAALTGRRKFEIAANSIAVVTLYGLMVAGFSRDSYPGVLNLLLILVPIVSWLVATCAFVLAYRRGLMSRAQMILAAVTAVTAAGLVGVPLSGLGPAFAICGSAAGAWAAAPMITIPLAVSWNRHR